MIKNVKQSLKTGDKSFNQVLRHSFWAFMFLGIATGLQFLFDFLLARSYGANGTGVFYLSLSVLSLAAMVGRIGFDRSVIRFLPPLMLEQKYDQARGLLRLMNQLTVYLAITLAVGLYLLAPTMAESLFDDPELVDFLRIFSLVIPAFALLHVFAGSLRGLKRIRDSLLVERIIIYGGAIVALATFAADDLQLVFYAFLVACYGAMLYGLWTINRQVLPATPKSFNRSKLLHSAIPLFIVSLATLMFGQITTVLLGALADTEAVGVFSIAFKISMLMNLVLVGINSIGATMFSELHARGDSLKTLAQKMSALALVLALPLFVAFILVPGPILSLFGSEFEVGASTLMVLAAGQLINTSVGSANHILTVTGHEKKLAAAIGLSVVLSVILSFILIPAHGVLGAGIAVAISIATSNTAQLLLIRKHLGIWSLPFGAIKRWLN